MLQTSPGPRGEGMHHPVRFEAGQIPLYLQIADHLRSRIRHGIWREGQTIPSLEVLAAEFQVARVTVRQAVQLLTQEELVVPRRGVGTVVRQHGVFHKANLQTSLADLAADYEDLAPVLLEFDDSGRKPPLPATVGALGKRYVYMRRLHLIEGQPCAVITLYLASAIYARAAAKFRKRPVISVLVQLGVQDIGEARQTLTIDSANVETARLLKIPPNAPVGRVERIFRDRAGTVIYTAELVYRGDWVKWEVDLQPSAKRGSC